MQDLNCFHFKFNVLSDDNYMYIQKNNNGSNTVKMQIMFNMF